MILTEDNYFSLEADLEYMSVSQFKRFAGTSGERPCEFTAMEELHRNWHEEKTTALLVGSYVDSYFEGTLDKFKSENPEIFTKAGDLKSDYRKADNIIKRIEMDDYFMACLSGEKQRIMTFELFGCKWKIKMDSYLKDTAIVDLKIVESISKLKWVKDIGYLDFIRYWGYDIQGAVYQKGVEIVTGKKLPFYIAAASKEKETDIEVIQITQNFLDDALKCVESQLPRVLRVKNKEALPDKCNICDCCRHHKILHRPITILDITAGI